MNDEWLRLDDKTTWPRPGGELEWRLRYAPDSITREDILHAASVCHAYEHLTLVCTSRRRAAVVRRIRATLRREANACDTEFCECPEGPYVGTQMAPSLPRCERCRRPSDPRVMALLADNQRLNQRLDNVRALNERWRAEAQARGPGDVLITAGVVQMLAHALDAPQTDGGDGR